MPKRTVLFGSPWALQPFPRREGSGSRPRQQPIRRESLALQMPHQSKPARSGIAPRGARVPGVRGPRRAKWSPQLFVPPAGPLSPIQEEDSSSYSQCSPPCKWRRITQRGMCDEARPVAASTAETAGPIVIGTSRSASVTVAGEPSSSSAVRVPQSPCDLASSPLSRRSTTGKGRHKRCYPQDDSTPPRRLQKDSLAAPATQAGSLATPPRGQSSLLRRHRQRQSQEQCYSTFRPSGGIEQKQA